MVSPTAAEKSTAPGGGERSTPATAANDPSLQGMRAGSASGGPSVRDWAHSSGSGPGTGPVAGAGAGLGDTRRKGSSRWWKIRLFRGMANDLRKRAPYYVSDWLDAWNYRVVPATVYMFFANILPALAFSLDMFNKTDMHYGVNEVLLSSVLGAVVFSVLACQPLVIVGVTGPITVFNYTVYDIMKPTGTNYMAFMCWIGLWSLVFHWVLAITNSCNWLRYVTRFPCDIFGFYVAFIYLQKGIQILETLGDAAAFYLSLAVALLVFAVAYICGELGRSSLFSHPVRVFLKDYGTPLTLIFFTGFVHMGKMQHVPLETLPTGRAFTPTMPERGWFVRFWDIPLSDVFVAIPFAVLLTVLFWFDHNVSSLIAQGTEFPLRKPAGFHWDLFLLGLTTGVAGLLGLPFPNGLIPQAPFHTESLCVTEAVVVPPSGSGSGSGSPDSTDCDNGNNNTNSNSGTGVKLAFRPAYVVEQRVSNLAQGLLTLVAMAGPLLHVLHLIPQGVLAGLFFIMGFQALEGNGITAKLLFLLRDRALTPLSHPLSRARRSGGGGVEVVVVRRRAVWLFVLVELAGFGATFAITQTVAAVGFPVFILLLIPVRATLLPRWLTPQELAVLDEPTASPFTMESVGGSFGGPGRSGESGCDDGDNHDDHGHGIFLDAPERESGEETDRSGRQKAAADYLGGRVGGRSDVELAELGESRSGAVRRRLSTLHREG
ncbi:HCO3 transporter family-domain-containing protein [Chaetomium strumarium]|uniref:HCO3 transporter family-domain-containing protein n=1 Tax=Chaetomium strumarium TaxID=1170767 RepID=A0AAJ0M4F7_9PEZI|nr:HCO3 transporter family-domain-containing protein [Chaetomium strumarium]